MCYLTYTNAEHPPTSSGTIWTARPIYSGVIEGVGPRYCPSIETKVVRFADKPRHQLFIEPMGLDTEELYIQGFSSSMPEEVQLQMLHTVAGLEHAEMMRPRLRHRVRLRRPTGSCGPRWRSRRSPACTARDSSTAPPAMRRRRPRASWPASTRP